MNPDHLGSRIDDDPNKQVESGQGKKAYYRLPELGWIIEMVAYDVSVNVVFFGGADFDPPPPLGTTGRTRYVKLKTLEKMQTPEMHKWIEQAGHVPGWK